MVVLAAARLFWAAHSMHRSSRHFTMSTAVRLPWLIPGKFLTSVVYVPMAVLGVPVWLIFLGQAVVLLLQFPPHTERIGTLPRAIEFVVNAPSHHRVRYGLTHDIDTYNPVKVNYREFAAMVRDVWRAETWRGRLGYLLAPPGGANRHTSHHPSISRKP
ncbi:sterol desaturase family protein [Mycobacterium sp. PS03-16]|uniref:sterol desaturase family protein n=1 Tax=Mycobacterium sp. PS03-16 TaxID=2559611 RepID=UPI001FD7EAA4|nr:hypothetical protein [Mycobacterium sp. PS03-16]